nr:gustatory receptor 46.2 [Papilio memnon]
MSCLFLVVKMFWRNKCVEKSNKALIKHNIDSVLDNFVEAEAKTILLPLYVAQCLTFAPKYSIRYDLITSNSHKFNVFVFLCSMGIISLWLYSVFDHVAQSRGISAATSYAYIVTLIVTMIFNSTITISKSNMNAYLIVLIRRIQKTFKFVDFKKRGISVGNWAYVIAIVAFNLIHSTFRVVETPSGITRIFFTHLIYISIDCNIIIAIRMMHLLGKLIETWISELECLCLTFSLEIVETDNNRIKDCRTKDIISAYDELIDSLGICAQVFKVPIFLTVVISFFQVIFNVQYLITIKCWQITMLVSQILWMKNIILIILLSMECEKVLLELKNAQTTCLVLTSTERIDLSCLLRRQRHQVEVYWEGGPLPLDAALPLRFLAVVATYTIVILQFHFL